MGPEDRERLSRLSRFWGLPSALRAATEASDVEGWWAELRRKGVLQD